MRNAGETELKSIQANIRQFRLSQRLHTFRAASKVPYISLFPKSIQSKSPLCLAEDILQVLKPLRLLYYPAELVYSKLTTTIVSTFTSHYVFLWPTYFPSIPLTPPLPSFDGRSVLYPSVINLRDYLSWRQVDCM